MSALTVRLTWERPVGNIIRYIITYFSVNEPSQQYNHTVLDSTMLTTIVTKYNIPVCNTGCE